MKTVKDLMNRANNAIYNREDLAFDVAMECGQMLYNVSHMTWFKKAVALQLISDVSEYRHLEGMIK